MNKLVAFASLALACIFVACAQPQPAPTPVDAGPHGDVATPPTTPPPHARVRRDFPFQPSKPVPPKPDTRTPAQLAQAACAGADGKWRCPKLARKMILASNGSQPIIPASWTVPNWYIDPANSSGCASDSNSGTSSTCSAGGVGPLATYQELNVHRWGCLGNPSACPRLRQNTTITWLSSATGDTDPVYFAPGVENNAFITLKGALGAAQQIASGTLSNVTAKNRSTPQLLQAQSGATGADQLVVNSTHASRAWTYKLVSGSIYAMTEPEAPVTLPTYSCGSSVDTWANGDSVTVYQPVSIDLVSVQPTIEQLNGSLGFVTVYNLNVLDPSALNTVYLSGTTMMESSSARYVRLGWQTPFNYSMCNVDAEADITNSVISAGTTTISGGVAGKNGTQVNLLNASFTGDFIAAGTVSLGTTIANGSTVTSVYIESGVEFHPTSASINAAGGVFWGPGVIELAGSSTLTYSSGAGKAAITFLVPNGNLQPNGYTTACLGVPTSTGVGACNKSVTATDLDTDLGATLGCYFVPGGASICNGDL